MLGRRTNVIGPRRLLFRYCTEGNFALQPSRRRASCPTLLARGSNKNRIIAIIIMIIIMTIIIATVVAILVFPSRLLACTLTALHCCLAYACRPAVATCAQNHLAELHMESLLQLSVARLIFLPAPRGLGSERPYCRATQKQARSGLNIQICRLDPPASIRPPPPPAPLAPRSLRLLFHSSKFGTSHCVSRSETC